MVEGLSFRWTQNPKFQMRNDYQTPSSARNITTSEQTSDWVHGVTVVYFGPRDMSNRCGRELWLGPARLKSWQGQTTMAKNSFWNRLKNLLLPWFCTCLQHLRPVNEPFDPCKKAMASTKRPRQLRSPLQQASWVVDQPSFLCWSFCPQVSPFKPNTKHEREKNETGPQQVWSTCRDRWVDWGQDHCQEFPTIFLMWRSLGNRWSNYV